MCRKCNRKKSKKFWLSKYFNKLMIYLATFWSTSSVSPVTISISVSKGFLRSLFFAFPKSLQLKDQALKSYILVSSVFSHHKLNFRQENYKSNCSPCRKMSSALLPKEPCWLCKIIPFFLLSSTCPPLRP